MTQSERMDIFKRAQVFFESPNVLTKGEQKELIDDLMEMAKEVAQEALVDEYVVRR